MVVNPINTETLILNNIVTTLSQLKQSGVANAPLVIAATGSNATVLFFVDPAKTITLFTDDAVSNPSRFTVAGTNTLYVPPDSLINDTATISTTFAQPTYYVTATFMGRTFNLTYNNAQNLVFASVIVASKKDPAFSTNGNEAVIVPGEGKLNTLGVSGDTSIVILHHEIYIQLNVFDWTNLSEQNREAARVNATNTLRLALYADRFRNGKATQYDHDLQGTNVDTVKLLPSTDVLKGCCKVRVAYMATSTSY